MILKREASNIETDYIYVDMYVGSCINKYGINKTQEIINNFSGEQRFFICQHIYVHKLNFEDSIVFSPHSHIDDQVISIPHYTLTSNHKNNSQRNLLFSFIGSVKTYPLRAKIVQKYNHCFDTGVKWAVDAELSATVKNYFKQKYIDLANRSVFSLCPRGAGISTIRLFESMSMGSIPVIIADGFSRPMEDFLDWNEFSITINESDVDKIEDELKSVHQGKIKAMQKKVRKVYSQYFSNDKLPEAILKEIQGKRRLFPDDCL